MITVKKAEQFDPAQLTETAKRAIYRAAERIARYEMTNAVSFTDTESTKKHLVNLYRSRESEMFGVLFLDNKHNKIAIKEMFQGTVDGCSVHPREVVKEALLNNAAAVILFHNHPSGSVDPSRGDVQITRRLTEGLALVDVRVLDHVVIGAADVYSFAENGQI